MVSCLTCDHKVGVGGSISCQAKATLLIRSEIALSLKSEAEFIMSNKLRCYVH